MSQPLILKPLPPAAPPVQRSRTRWLWPLLIFVAVVLPGLIALEIALMRFVGQRSSADQELTGAVFAGEQIEEPPSTAPAVHPAPSPAVGGQRAAKTQEIKADPRPLPQAGTAPAELREALGGLTGSHLYQSHLNIGLIADAVEKDLYTLEKGRELLDDIAGLLNAVGKKLKRLPPETLPAEEHEYLEGALAVEKLLRAQIDELRKYWDTDEKARAERFQKTRKRTWTALQDLLRPTP
jgi:hypothetical protein